MDFKKRISFELKKVSQEDVIEIDGISFSNIAYVVIIVDGQNLLELDFFEGSFLVFGELKRSLMHSGSYLLFTGVSGVADDAGWDYVEVIHEADLIVWKLQRDNISVSYTFDKSDYLKEIISLEKKITNLRDGVKLEPQYVIHPE